MEGYISTYIIYNLIFLPFLFYFMAAKFYPKKIRFYIFYVSSFFILIAISGLRYRVGADYESYSWIYNNLELYQSGYSVEWGFYYLVKLLNLLNLDEQFLFFTVSFLTIYFIFRVDVNRNDIFLFLVLFYVLLFYFRSFNEIRQIMAMSIVFYALISYLNNFKLFYFFIFVCFASLFHSSVILFVPLILFARLIRYRIVIFLITLLLSIFLMFFDVGGFLLEHKLLSFSKLEYYLYDDHYSLLSTTLGAIAKLLMKSFVVICLFFIPSRYFNDVKKAYNVTLYLNSALLVFIFASYNFYVLPRVVLLFELYILCSVYVVLKSSYNRKYLILSLGAILNFMLYEYFVFIETYYDTAPYQSILDRNY